MRKLLYNVMNGKKAVMEGVTAEEIREFFGMPGMKMADYTGKKFKVKGKYTIEKMECVKKEEKRKIYMPEIMKQEWTEECRKFQNVVWVQQWRPGVKVLKIRGA